MTKNPPRENAVKPFVRIIDYNNLTPEESKTIFINKNNIENPNDYTKGLYC